MSSLSRFSSSLFSHFLLLSLLFLSPVSGALILNLVSTSDPLYEFSLLRGTIIDLSRDICANPVFMRNCNGNQTSELMNESLFVQKKADEVIERNGKTFGHELKVLDLYACVSIWGTDACSWSSSSILDDGTTDSFNSISFDPFFSQRLTGPSSSSLVRNDSIHILVPRFCSCDVYGYEPPSNFMISSIEYQEEQLQLVMKFSSEVAVKDIGTPVPLNQFFSPHFLSLLGSSSSVSGYFLNRRTLIIQLASDFSSNLAGARVELLNEAGSPRSGLGAYRFPWLKVKSSQAVTVPLSVMNGVECKGAPCGVRGRCIPLNNTGITSSPNHTCQCLPGYSGLDCSIVSRNVERTLFYLDFDIDHMSANRAMVSQGIFNDLSFALAVPPSRFALVSARTMPPRNNSTQNGTGVATGLGMGTGSSNGSSTGLSGIGNVEGSTSVSSTGGLMALTAGGSGSTGSSGMRRLLALSSSSTGADSIFSSTGGVTSFSVSSFSSSASGSPVSSSNLITSVKIAFLSEPDPSAPASVAIPSEYLMSLFLSQFHDPTRSSSLYQGEYTRFILQDYGTVQDGCAAYLNNPSDENCGEQQPNSQGYNYLWVIIVCSVIGAVILGLILLWITRKCGMWSQKNKTGQRTNLVDGKGPVKGDNIDAGVAGALMKGQDKFKKRGETDLETGTSRSNSTSNSNRTSNSNSNPLTGDSDADLRHVGRNFVRPNGSIASTANSSAAVSSIGTETLPSSIRNTPENQSRALGTTIPTMTTNANNSVRRRSNEEVSQLKPTIVPEEDEVRFHSSTSSTPSNGMKMSPNGNSDVVYTFPTPLSSSRRDGRFDAAAPTAVRIDSNDVSREINGNDAARRPAELVLSSPASASPSIPNPGTANTTTPLHTVHFQAPATK